MTCTVQIENSYEDGHESVSVVEVESPEFPDDEEYMDDWWNEEVFPHTGDGHGGEAYYEARIIRAYGDEKAVLEGLTYDWQG